MRRILLAMLAATTLVLSGCGGDGGGNGSLADVKVSAAQTPKVTVAKGFETGTTKNRVVQPGSGDALRTDDTVKVNYVAVNGRTGEEFDSSYRSGEPLTFKLNEKSVINGFIKGLKGEKIGSRVLVAIPPKDGFNSDQEQLKLKKDDTIVFLFDILGKVPDEATGTAKKLPADVPAITFDADQHPSGFKATSKTAKKVTKQSIEVAIEGDGPAIKKGQQVTIQYVGQGYPDGQVFDESWSTGARPLPVGTGTLYACWDEQLVGQKVGSRVVLVCPPDKSYAGQERPTGVKEGQPVIFVLDLLDAS